MAKEQSKRYPKDEDQNKSPSSLFPPPASKPVNGIKSGIPWASHHDPPKRESLAWSPDDRSGTKAISLFPQNGLVRLSDPAVLWDAVRGEKKQKYRILTALKREMKRWPIIPLLPDADETRGGPATTSATAEVTLGEGDVQVGCLPGRCDDGWKGGGEVRMRQRSDSGYGIKTGDLRWCLP